MADDIAGIFPQLEEITDPDLRYKVEACWREALQRGGWLTEDLDKIPFTLAIEGCDLSLAAHTRNVTDCSLALGRILDAAYSSTFRIDFDILVAGALLHDVGKLLEYRRDGRRFSVSAGGRLLRHPISGCALTAELGLPEPVQHIIATHSREGNGGHRSPESYIVHHSDFVNFEPLKDR